MSAPRKRWATAQTVWAKTMQPSKKAAYEAVAKAAERWQEGVLRSRHMSVYVDERDGHGWQLYERVDLTELAGRTA